jgi:hypothetical protein
MKSALPGYAELRERIQAAPRADLASVAHRDRRRNGIGEVVDRLVARMAIRDVGRAFGFLYRLSDPKADQGRQRSCSFDRISDRSRAARYRGRILLLEALNAIGRQPNFLVYVDGDPDPHAKYSQRIRDYRARHDPRSEADFVLPGYDDRDELERTDP